MIKDLRYSTFLRQFEDGLTNMPAIRHGKIYPLFSKKKTFYRLDSGVDEQKAKGQLGKETHGQQAGAKPKKRQAQEDGGRDPPEERTFDVEPFGSGIGFENQLEYEEIVDLARWDHHTSLHAGEVNQNLWGQSQQQSLKRKSTIINIENYQPTNHHMFSYVMSKKNL
jgi:hypothetical protein